MTERIPRDFYAQNTLSVARQALGMRLVRMQEGQRLAGIITEIEAYRGSEDLGCHARSGLTPRTQVMFGPPGYTYVYFTYGMHWLLNFVTEPAGYPSAVLIRAIQPVEGLEIIAQRRGRQPMKLWTDGPAKLCQALGMDGRHNGLDLCDPAADIFLEYGEAVPDSCVTTGPRVGLYHVPEPWKSIPWRFQVKDRGSTGTHPNLS